MSKKNKQKSSDESQNQKSEESVLKAVEEAELANLAFADEDDANEEVNEAEDTAVGTELEAYESAEVEDIEEVTAEDVMSVVESLLFASPKPLSPKAMKSAFQGTNIRIADIRKALEQLMLDYANPVRGVTLEEVAGGYQLRSKPDNHPYLKQTLKVKPFKLSGQALEVLSIVAYKQPTIKSQVDEIRGVESGHLMRGLLDRGLIRFAGKSELPGRPMYYETTKKFLEIFGLRNIKELPTLSEIDDLLPDGIGEVEEEKEVLSDLTGKLSQQVGTTYSEGEEELESITSELSDITTFSEFFEEEKKRQREERDAKKAQDIRERMIVGEEVSTRDQNWLSKYDEAQKPQEEEPEPEASM